jgi:hypothetical protein
LTKKKKHFLNVILILEGLHSAVLVLSFLGLIVGDLIFCIISPLQCFIGQARCKHRAQGAGINRHGGYHKC